ncbi:MAG: glycosyltransferase [Candidatus Kapaibacterium sp.]
MSEKPQKIRNHNNIKPAGKKYIPNKDIHSEDNKQNINTESRKTFRDAKIDISVVIPLLNEADSLPELSLLLEEELTKLSKGRWEVIFVDDGSTDDSFDMIKQINKRNKRFKCIRFRRNYGKSAALSVAFAKAVGNIVITMDADLQDDPTEISNLIDKIHEGYDLVSGWKKKRYDPISKTLPSKLFNSVTSAVSGIKLHDFNCGLKAYRKTVVKTVKIYGEMHRYIPSLAFWEGFKVTEIPVKHHPRRYGKSKFGVSRFMYGFLDLLTVLFTTKYFKRPLHFFGSVGFLLTFVGLIINLYLTYEWVMGLTYLSNRPLALFGVALIIVGIQFISMGLIGEMIIKNFMLTNQNKYSIKEII